MYIVYVRDSIVNSIKLRYNNFQDLNCGRLQVTDEQLKSILDKIEINECEEIIENYIYYIKKQVRQRYSRGDGSFGYAKEEYEFLIIAEGFEKQAIILRCGYGDLQWHVLRRWRKKHILSNALRTGVLREIWPENTKITCCYNYYDNHEQKYNMTKHLADIAGLSLE